ncbi:MAG: hypothetical protein QOC60_421 [Frankiaceae bacterium]|jgi:hypothetical protein|nr:hypothetical protein [Frankiaceae bacterium]
MTPDDEQLLRELSVAARQADPIPDQVQILGRASFGLSRLDAELAQLTSDSDELLTGVRSAGTDVRLLTFEAEGLVIEAQVSAAGARRSVLGQVIDVDIAAGTVSLETAYLSRSDATLDDVGAFRFEGLAAGTVRLVVTLPSGRNVATRWFRL